MNKQSKALLRAIKIVGGKAALARNLGVSRQAVQQWARRKKLPAEKCRQAEALTGIPRAEFRPDIYAA